MRQGLANTFVRVFNSFKTMIVLCLAIAGSASIGTFLPQDQGPAVILTSTFPGWLKQLLLAIRAHDVYHAPWFLALLALLFLNIAVGTWIRFPPIWRRILMKVPGTPKPHALPNAVVLDRAPEPALLLRFAKRGYRATDLGDGQVFLESQKWVRWYTSVIHLSLFLILAGSILGGLMGVKHSTPLFEGDELKGHEWFETARTKGVAAAEPAGFSVKLDKFWMAFRPTGQVKQYYSDLTVTPAGGAPYQKRIMVNEPLIVDGVYFYQSYWGIGALSLRTGDTTRQISLTPAKSGGSISEPFAVGAGRYVLFVRDVGQPAVLVAADTLETAGSLLPGLPLDLAGTKVELLRYHLFSGLESKRDPGIPLVYLGCGLLLLGLAGMPIAHKEAWLLCGPDGRWHLGGRATKGKLMMQKELAAIAADWNAGAASAAPLAQGA